ncbi:DUF3987 domain-containing protein [Patescibacteria group bacterium]|uniref:Putative primase n=1 Tax=viral metagenome TaxID=1070528 RepID=A0A6M3KPR4_9ZZZZ|nr:DUF3987 domain-containing protein [Patescibacteria group bacterium]
MTKRQVPDWISGYLKYTDNSEPPVIYRKWVAISAIASMLQRRCSITIGLNTWYPNFYIVLVGDSGVKKSTSMDPAQKLLVATGIELAAESITREGLIHRLRQCGSNPIIDPVTKTMTMHSSLTVHSSEFIVFLGFQDRQMLGILCDLYSCRSTWRHETKTIELRDDITNVWLNIIGATTPTLLKSNLPPESFGGGLTSRVIFVYATKKDSKFIPISFLSDEEIELQGKLLDDLGNMLLISGEFRMTDEFIERYAEWSAFDHDNPPFEDPRFSGYNSHRREFILKLSMVISVSTNNSMILTLTDINRAIDTLTEVEEKMPLTFSGVGKSDIAPQMSLVMTTIATKGTVTFGELLRLYYNDVDEWTMKRILVTLIRMEFCKQTVSGKEIIIDYIPEKKKEEK